MNPVYEQALQDAENAARAQRDLLRQQLEYANFSTATFAAPTDAVYPQYYDKEAFRNLKLQAGGQTAYWKPGGIISVDGTLTSVDPTHATPEEEALQDAMVNAARAGKRWSPSLHYNAGQYQDYHSMANYAGKIINGMEAAVANGTTLWTPVEEEKHKPRRSLIQVVLDFINKHRRIARAKEREGKVECQDTTKSEKETTLSTTVPLTDSQSSPTLTTTSQPPSA